MLNNMLFKPPSHVFDIWFDDDSSAHLNECNILPQYSAPAQPLKENADLSNLTSNSLGQRTIMQPTALSLPRSLQTVNASRSQQLSVARGISSTARAEGGVHCTALQ